MPIGTIIGWLTGQFIIGYILNLKNSSMKTNQAESAVIARQLIVIISAIMIWTAFFGLLGTGIELLVR